MPFDTHSSAQDTSPSAGSAVDWRENVPHARVSPPWSCNVSPAWFPGTWGTLFARKLGDGVFGLYHDRTCEKHFVRHATGGEVAAGSAVCDGRRFDVEAV